MPWANNIWEYLAKGYPGIQVFLSPVFGITDKTLGDVDCKCTILVLQPGGYSRYHLTAMIKGATIKTQKNPLGFQQNSKKPLAPIVQMLDNNIHWIKNITIQQISITETNNCSIHWIALSTFWTTQDPGPKINPKKIPCQISNP